METGLGGEEVGVVKRFRKRIGRLEVRVCNENLLAAPPYTTAEIIMWEENLRTNYVVAHWRGGDLSFVGLRPLASDVKWSTFRKLVEFGQQRIDKEHRR